MIPGRPWKGGAGRLRPPAGGGILDAWPSRSPTPGDCLSPREPLMSTRTQRLALAAAAFLVPAAPAAHAQPYRQYYMCYGYCPSPQPYYSCYGYCPNRNPYYTCYGYCPGNNSPYYNVYNPDPFYGYLSGSAEVINAQGKYMVSAQQANLVKEHVERDKIANKRRAIDEWLYERKVLPTPEDERERDQREMLRYMQNDPPATEIYAGPALNVLLADLQQLRNQGVTLPRL